MAVRGRSALRALAALAVACSQCVDAFAPSSALRPGLRPAARMPVPSGPARRASPLVLQTRPRRATFLGGVRAEAGEEALVPPPKEMAGAYVDSMEQYEKMYRESLDDPEAFWSKIGEDFHWEKRWDKLNEVNFDNDKGPVSIKWFLGAKTNLAYNALDRHVLAGKGDKVAFFWEGNEPSESITYTYAELLDKVKRFANVLKSKGVKKGDNVAIYLPMVAELPVAMLACARIGAVHSVVFGGFSAEALASRIIDSKAKVLITADGTMRGAKLIDLLNIADKANAIVDESGEHKVSNVIVVERKPCADAPKLKPGKHESFTDLVAAADKECAVEWVDAEDPLFLLYTSGSTGKPKGVVHTSAGYMVWASTTFKYVFDYKEDDVFWCTADCGWITGHSYLTYGPMVNGATQVSAHAHPMRGGGGGWVGGRARETENRGRGRDKRCGPRGVAHR